MAYRTVNNHGGEIVLQSKEGLGTTVSIYLPTVDKNEAEEDYAGNEVAPRCGTILVVETMYWLLPAEKWVVMSLQS